MLNMVCEYNDEIQTKEFGLLLVKCENTNLLGCLNTFKHKCKDGEIKVFCEDCLNKVIFKENGLNGVV